MQDPRLDKSRQTKAQTRSQDRMDTAGMEVNTDQNYDEDAATNRETQDLNT